MSRLITSGLELGTLSTSESVSSPDGQPSSATGITVDTAHARLGIGACQSFAGSNTAKIYREWDFATSATDIYFRAYARISSKPTGSESPFFLHLSGATLGIVAGIRYEAPGDVVTLLVNNASTLITSTTFHPVLNVWYRYEIHLKIGTGATDAIDLLIDGISYASATNIDVGVDAMTSITQFLSGWTTQFISPTSAAIQIDDVALNDTVGGSQNSWPGSGKIVLLVPSVDSAVGTGWTDDNAATTSLFSSVKTEPPGGVADTTAGGGGHQIRNSTSNANVNYDATLTTYAAAGLRSADTVSVVVPIIATAAPVTTSSKQGTMGVVSNPAIANIALGSGGTAGAFWSGTAAGIYPIGWKWSFGTTTYAPTVVHGTASVMRVTQVTSSTRVAMACFMGIYVDYVPVFIPRNPAINFQDPGMLMQHLGKGWRKRRNIFVPRLWAPEPACI